MLKCPIEVIAELTGGLFGKLEVCYEQCTVIRQNKKDWKTFTQ